MTVIIRTVVIISGISGSLAYLLSLANKVIANYGEKKLIINDDKEYIVTGGDTLLSSLIEQEVFIPSACGGKGSCGYCKVKVLEGGGRFLPTESGYVTEEEKENGVRLSCQLKVKEDIRIKIPEELFNVKQYDYYIDFIEDVTDKIKHIRVNLPEGKEINFKAGQYIQLLAPKYKGNPDEIYRAYSIASSPNDTTSLELFIGYVPDGIATTYVHQYLKPSDRLTIVGPYGEFFYHPGDREMIMVAIGTGLAPIMSILRYMRDEQIDREVTFYFGSRTRSDLYMMDELKELEKELPNFKLRVCLSRPTKACNWNGDEGRVTDLLEKYMTESGEKEAYLCGSPPMIDSVIEILKDKGMPEALIYYDKFE
ncbi:MAG TPA: 2Fe-2S iron-sulfur cluster binding domain-containing protein [Clostridia bacterium]|nr:2Fe-2S iron-sulfur cluster binding domain-containing protein [Clostridia bacterium]